MTDDEDSLRYQYWNEGGSIVERSEMTKDQAVAELQRIREELDVLGAPIFLSLEAAEDAAKDSNLARLAEASPIDRRALFRALFMTMNAVGHLAAHIEYLLKGETSLIQIGPVPNEAGLGRRIAP